MLNSYENFILGEPHLAYVDAAPAIPLIRVLLEIIRNKQHSKTKVPIFLKNTWILYKANSKNNENTRDFRYKIKKKIR